jgi:hypothetical protein
MLLAAPLQQAQSYALKPYLFEPKSLGKLSMSHVLVFGCTSRQGMTRACTHFADSLSPLNRVMRVRYGLQDVRIHSHHNTLRSSKPLSLPLCRACACIHSSSQLSLLRMQWLQLASRSLSLVASQGWAAAACSSSLSGTLRLVSSSTAACKEGALPNSCECFCTAFSGSSQYQQVPTGHDELNSAVACQVHCWPNKVRMACIIIWTDQLPESSMLRIWWLICLVAEVCLPHAAHWCNFLDRLCPHALPPSCMLQHALLPAPPLTIHCLLSCHEYAFTLQHSSVKW